MADPQNPNDQCIANSPAGGHVTLPDGRVVPRSAQFVPEVLRGTARPFTGLTPYARSGNWPVVGLCFLMLAAAARLRPRQGAVRWE